MIESQCRCQIAEGSAGERVLPACQTDRDRVMLTRP